MLVSAASRGWFAPHVVGPSRLSTCDRATFTRRGEVCLAAACPPQRAVSGRFGIPEGRSRWQSRWRPHSSEEPCRRSPCAALVLTAFVAPVAASNILGNGGFEVPHVHAGNVADFINGSTLGTCGLAMPGSPGYHIGCWRCSSGALTSRLRRTGRPQAVNSRSNSTAPAPVQVLQLYGASPNTTYQLSFELSGDPFLAGTVSLLAVQEQFDGGGNYITGAAIGSYSFDTTGHTTTSMGYELVKGTFTTGASTDYVDVELQTLTQNNSRVVVGSRRRQCEAQDQVGRGSRSEVHAVGKLAGSRRRRSWCPR